MARTKSVPEAIPAIDPSPQSKTKAQAIRDALTVDPDGMPKAIAERLSAEGWNVKAKDVSQAKFLLGRAKQKRGKKAASQPAKAAAAPSDPDLVSVAALQKAKKLIQELGGVNEAKRALAALAQLLN